MSNSYLPLINRLLQVAETAAGSDSRTIPANTFRYDTVATKDVSSVSQDAVVRPVFEVDDVIPRDNKSYSEHASTCLYDIEIRITATYKVNTGIPDWNKKELIALMRDDAHKVRRAYGNPDTLTTYEGTDTGLASGMLEFANASPIRWINSQDGVSALASQTLTFTGKLTLDFV